MAKRIISQIFIIGILTLFTQVGGLIWLLCYPIFFWTNARWSGRWQRRLVKWSSFALVYLAFTSFLIPPLAKWQCNRVPLPIWENPNLKPHSVFYYCILNHHYVKPELKATAENVAERLAKKYPGTVLVYLDANFPFIDGYPLEPHFSHRDGKKLDIALHWTDAKNQQLIFGSPSWYGYGASAKALPGENDMSTICKTWYRNLLVNAAEVFLNKESYEFDEQITREMIRLFAKEKTVGKILLEPHLKSRLGFGSYSKIRFAGCHAAPHDDHIHVQM